MKNYNVKLSLVDDRDLGCYIDCSREIISINGVPKEATEEVVNHIRDAISSMLAAVKAFNGPVA